MDGSDPAAYRNRVVDRLRALVDSRGYSVADVEKKLAHSRGYVADGLRGVKKLTVEVILEVLAAIDVPPEAFFERPMPQPAPFRRRRGRRPSRRPAAVSADDLDASSPVVRGMLRLLAERGLLTPEDLAEVQRELFPGEPPAPPRS